MDDIYRELILDYYKSPRNFGKLDHPTHSCELNNPLCGDQIMMDVEIISDVINKVSFSGQGCAISMASASMLTEKVLGQETSYLRSLTKDDIVKMLGIKLSPTRLKCALLGLEVLQKAVRGETKK